MWLGFALRSLRRPGIRGVKLRLYEPLHNGAVLAVALPAAALLLAAVLGRHVVVAAVVTEDASAEPEKKRQHESNELSVTFTFYTGEMTATPSMVKEQTCFLMLFQFVLFFLIHLFLLTGSDVGAATR